MSGMCSMTRKVLWDNSSQHILKLLQGMGKLATNTKVFMEQVKIIFNQKGFVASGLSAEIRVAPNPVNFAISM
jgi:hypothetical protein